ncbi:MAG TPA: hypothetical protein VJY39_09260 [Acidisphaera sp.]|nr:hypothetical protein [Acidisphaera sp.]
MRNMVLMASILVGVAATAQGDIAPPSRSPAVRPVAATVRRPATMLPTAMFGVCDDLAQGRLDFAASQASNCCDQEACARLLATTVLRRPQHDLRT